MSSTCFSLPDVTKNVCSCYDSSLTGECFKVCQFLAFVCQSLYAMFQIGSVFGICMPCFQVCQFLAFVCQSLYAMFQSVPVFGICMPIIVCHVSKCASFWHFVCQSLYAMFQSVPVFGICMPIIVCHVSKCASFWHLYANHCMPCFKVCQFLAFVCQSLYAMFQSVPVFGICMPCFQVCQFLAFCMPIIVCHVSKCASFWHLTV